MVEIVVYVAGDKQVEPTIAVVVAERSARRPVAQSYPGFLGNVGESAIVIIVIEAILAEIGYVQVGPSVVVVIADGNPETPAVIGNPGLLSNISEGAIMIVMEQSGMRRRGLSCHCVICRSVD
jgi:hypothetical protein